MRQLSDCRGSQKGNLCEALLQWERSEYFIPEGEENKKEDSIKMGYFGCLLSPLVSGFNSETSGPGQMLQRMGRAGQPWIQGPAVQPTLE